MSQSQRPGGAAQSAEAGVPYVPKTITFPATPGHEGTPLFVCHFHKYGIEQGNIARVGINVSEWSLHDEGANGIYLHS